MEGKQQTLDKQLEELYIKINEAPRKEDARVYASLLEEYKSVSDESMPYVFAEFQRALGKKVRFDAPHETPQEMRVYLAHVHSVLRRSKII
jgi:hypothetical protein